MPEWTFVDIIPPDELVARAHIWRKKGVTCFGGCCGLGPEHIKALSREFAR
jgi:methionine synthase I (cobalamin-dependent)